MIIMMIITIIMTTYRWNESRPALLFVPLRKPVRNGEIELNSCGTVVGWTQHDMTWHGITYAVCRKGREGNTPSQSTWSYSLNASVWVLIHSELCRTCFTLLLYNANNQITWYNIMWYHMVWYGMTWHDMTWYDMMQYNTIWYDMI